MTQGFQQQNSALNFNIPKSAATQQHGQKAVETTAVPNISRSFKPRPGH